MRRTDNGFTLVEILVTVVISGILFGVMTQATIIGFKTIDTTNDRVAGSNDTQLIASYFTGDVDSAYLISTKGTTRHAAAGIGVSDADSMLLAFWTSVGVTTMTQDVMLERWDASSPGPATADRVSIAMAEDSADDPGNRVADSEVGTSSVSHTLLVPRQNALLPVTHRASRTGQSSGSQLMLDKPTGTVTNDVMFAQVAVGTATTAVTPPEGWTVVSEKASARSRSLVYRRTATSSEAASWTWTFGGAVESVGAIAAYSGVRLASPVSANATDVSPCGGDTSVLRLEWTDFATAVVTEITYTTVVAGEEATLERRVCTGATGTPTQKQVIARRLLSTARTDVFAECQPVACGPVKNGVRVTMTLTEKAPRTETVPRRYQMHASTRTTRQ